MAKLFDFLSGKVQTQNIKEEEQKEYEVIYDDCNCESEDLVLSDMEAIEVIDKLLDAKKYINEVLDVLGGGEIEDISEVIDDK